MQHVVSSCLSSEAFGPNICASLSRLCSQVVTKFGGFGDHEFERSLGLAHS